MRICERNYALWVGFFEEGCEWGGCGKQVDRGDERKLRFFLEEGYVIDSIVWIVVCSVFQY